MRIFEILSKYEFSYVEVKSKQALVRKCQNETENKNNKKIPKPFPRLSPLTYI